MQCVSCDRPIALGVEKAYNDSSIVLELVAGAGRSQTRAVPFRCRIRCVVRSDGWIGTYAHSYLGG